MSVVFVKCYFYVDVSNCRWEEREAFLIFNIFISFLLSAFVFSTGLTIVISYSLKNTQKYIYSSSHLFSLLHLSTNSCWQQSRWREVFFFCFLQAEETEKERKEGLERRPVFCLKKTSLFWYGGQVAPLRTATHAVCAAPARRRENGRRGWKFKEISAAPDWPHLKFNLELRGPDLSLSCVYEAQACSPSPTPRTDPHVTSSRRWRFTKTQWRKWIKPKIRCFSALTVRRSRVLL